MSIRAEKIASVIKRTITNPISDLAMEFSAGMVTVTSVKLSPDLQIAKIYFHAFGGNISPATYFFLSS